MTSDADIQFARGRTWGMPPLVEFMARCALGLKRKWRPGSGSGAAAKTTSTSVQPIARETLHRALDQLGISAGSLLMVHADSGAIARLGWELPAFIDLLLDHLGAAGTLAMPSHPRLLTRDGQRVYDVRRSPSTVGLLSELFRRRPGVHRSQFPLSAAAAIGPQAEDLIAGHAHSQSPHDRHSPYARLAELHGKALCVGCPLDRMTILHVAEDELRDELPIQGFHVEQDFVVTAEGQSRPVRALVRAPWLWWYLSLSRWTAQMHRCGLATELTVAGVPLRAADAYATVDWMKAEVRRGKSIYPLAGLNRVLGLRGPATEDDA